MTGNELSDLSAFVAVAEERSFTRAAARLGTSQSAVSHVVRRLEARLGLRLLARTTRSVAPTQAGERLLRSAGPRIAEIMAELAALADLRDRPSGLIRITTSEHAARTLLWPAAAPLLRNYPAITLEVSIDGSLVDIVDQRFDAGIRLGESIAQDMVALRIGPEMRMAAFAAPEYFDQNGIPDTPHALARHRCINLRFLTRGDLYAWEFEKEGRALNVRVEGALIINSVHLLIDAALAGVGIGFTLEDHVAAQLASGKLVRILEDWCPPFPGYHLYYPGRRQHSAAFALLLDALRRRAG